MRGRVRDYIVKVVGNKVKVYCLRPQDMPPQVAEWEKQITEAIRLVVDETAKIVFCSSMQKDKVSVEQSDVTGYTFSLVFDIPEGKEVREGDQFTIELDWGEMLVTAKEQTLLDSKAEILDAIGGIELPEVNVEGVAKESTLQEIKNTLGVVDDKTFVAMTDEEITNELTDIWNTNFN